MSNDTNALEYEVLTNSVFRIGALGLYLSIGMLSLVGNMFIIHVVTTHQELRNVTTNLLIMNLAIADLFVTLTTLWMTPFAMLQWYSTLIYPFDENLCRLGALLNCSALLICAFTLMTIAIDRYYLIIHPFTKGINGPGCLVAVVGIWALSLIIPIPFSVHMEYCDLDRVIVCRELPWDPAWLKPAYSIFVLVARSVIPFSVISFSYRKIGDRLRKMEIRLSGRKSSMRDIAEIRRKKSLHRILVIMVVTYAVCSFPLDLYYLIGDICYMVGIKLKYHDLVFLCLHLITMTATLWNPLMYAYWNENFKREMPHSCSKLNRPTNTRSKQSFRKNSVCNMVRQMEERNPIVRSSCPVVKFVDDGRGHLHESDDGIGPSVIGVHSCNEQLSTTYTNNYNLQVRIVKPLKTIAQDHLISL